MYDTIINPIAALLGKIMDILFTGLNAIGLGNIAIAIILFTVIVKHASINIKAGKDEYS
mgnify:CR=1 FL=1